MTYKEEMIKSVTRYNAEATSGLDKVLSNVTNNRVEVAVMAATLTTTHTQVAWIILSRNLLSYMTDEQVDQRSDVELLLDMAFESCVRSHPHLAVSFINAKADMMGRIFQKD